MITEKAKHKLKVLSFWKKHGLTATEEAFGVKERTLYDWQAKLKKGNNNPEALNNRSKRPHTVRKRAWPEEIQKEIAHIRDEHPNLGKDKIYPALQTFCQTNRLKCPSISTIGNLIRDAGGLRKFPVKVRHNGKIVPRKRAKKSRKPKHFVATHPGHCGSFDTVERIVHGSKRYVITFTDVYSRFSLAWATRSHASLAAKEFFDLVTFLFPFPLTYALTDNGSEFMKHFDNELRRLHVTHWHTYPKCPKMNPHCERFNRSIQEEYIDYHESELLDTNKFNLGLMKHLLWHNTERPHFGINLQTPVQFISNYPHKDCKMYLTNTICCRKLRINV
jgi:transposase InsO family protein